MIDLELRGGVWAARVSYRERAAVAEVAWERKYRAWAVGSVAITVAIIGLGVATIALEGEPIPGDLALIWLLIWGPQRTLAGRAPRWRDELAAVPEFR